MHVLSIYTLSVFSLLSVQKNKMRVRRFYKKTRKFESSSERLKRTRFLFSNKNGKRVPVSSAPKESPVSMSEDPPEILSNFYHMLLIGLNWSKYLKKESPNIPRTITRLLWEEIGTVNILSLVEKFGTEPKRSDLPKIEEYLDIDLYLLYGVDFEKK